MAKIVFATNNAHKLKEAREILGNAVEVLSLNDISCHEELPETHDSLEDNSLEKAMYVKQHYGYDCFADDTGLEVEALDGKPGVFSARYATITEDGWNADHAESHDSKANMRKLLQMLKEKENRNAQFRTVVSLVRGDTAPCQMTGTVRGIISATPHGDEGFGYDPVFQPYMEDPDIEEPHTLSDRTFAEMTAEEKNSISHRGRAMMKLCKKLTQYSQQG